MKFIKRRLLRLFDKHYFRGEKNKVNSILSAVKEQGLYDLNNKITALVPDIKNQYSCFDVDSEYLNVKVRGQHSFQISLVLKAIDLFGLNNKNELTIVDIGDSAGTHINYLKGLLPNVRSLSINLDCKAVERIKNRGLEAICCRAEEVEKYNIQPDIFICFQTVEHLLSPIHFFKTISDKSTVKTFIVTVPYLEKSRVALNYIRSKTEKSVFAENTHIFEFSPEDWKLIFQFAGWKVKYERIYYQYPRNNKLLEPFYRKFWKEFDFEGFYGVVLEKDDTYKKLYGDWG